jgi:hypothetical protein
VQKIARGTANQKKNYLKIQFAENIASLKILTKDCREKFWFGKSLTGKKLNENLIFEEYLN